MENASKALIIAGSILLAIAIIGIGMYVFSSASNQIQVDDCLKEEIFVFNSQFERYEGEQTGKQVKLLLDTILTHNSTNDNKIKIKKDGDPVVVDVSDYSDLKNSLNDSTIYTIEFKVNKTTGLIEEMTSTPNPWGG